MASRSGEEPKRVMACISSVVRLGVMDNCERVAQQIAVGDIEFELLDAGDL
jgi:hypothetical protein